MRLTGRLRCARAVLGALVSRLADRLGHPIVCWLAMSLATGAGTCQRPERRSDGSARL